MRCSRRAAHPSHDGPVVRHSGRWGSSASWSSPGGSTRVYVEMKWRYHGQRIRSFSAPLDGRKFLQLLSRNDLHWTGRRLGSLLALSHLLAASQPGDDSSFVGIRLPTADSPTQARVKTESNQRTTAVDQFFPSLEQSSTTHNTQSTIDLAKSSNLSERGQIDLALKFRLVGRPAEQEKALRNPRSPEAKAMRALMIQEDAEDYRAAGMTTFDRSEAEKLATEALPQLKEDAKSRPLSMYWLGCLYRSGLGVPKDLQKAFRLSSEAANNGEKVAFRGLSVAYFLGEGVEKDEARSLEWARKGADAGDTVLMLKVSHAYDSGRCVQEKPRGLDVLSGKGGQGGQPGSHAEIQ